MKEKVNTFDVKLSSFLKPDSRWLSLSQDHGQSCVLSWAIRFTTTKALLKL